RLQSRICSGRRGAGVLTRVDISPRWVSAFISDHVNRVIGDMRRLIAVSIRCDTVNRRGAGVQVVTDIFDGGSDKITGIKRDGNIMCLSAEILVVSHKYIIRVIAWFTRHGGRLLMGGWRRALAAT